IDGKIWANVYTTDYVIIIDPKTGVVEGIIDFKGLLKEEDKTDETDVFNGIAYDAATKRIFVTGKLWNKLFEVEIVKR
ncbi:MAG: glutaminyl-peptide cyclotransferase, partial [Alistipes sp.]|nr:glutaminyl-peptide cyclotransferase [Alistipes sp.]